MGKKNELGKIYGRLKVIEEAGRSKDGNVLWKAICSCGNEIITQGKSLRNGDTQSCGCLNKEKSAERLRKYVEEFSFAKNKAIYRSWSSMLQRCYKEKHPEFHNYGGRGIIVCDEWKGNFEAFCKWALQNGHKEGLTIERIDHNGNYEPSNCTWITNKEQQNNKRTSRFITSSSGVRKTATQWARDQANIFNLSVICLKHRVFELGLTLEEALNLPRYYETKKQVVKTNPKTLKVVERFDSITEAAKKIGVNVSSLHEALTKKGRTCKGYIWKYADE